MTPSSFVWVGAPLSSPSAFLAAAGVYLALVFGLPHVVPKEGLGLRKLTAAHNVILCLWSLAMLFGCAWEVTARARREGTLGWFFCEDPSAVAKGPLYFWSYVYYVSKFYELLDTVLSRLNRARMPFPALHIFHHSCVLLMAWLWLEYAQTLQFGGLLFNTLVHVVMYYYYALKSLGLKVWWKKYITQLQIVQFVSSIVLLAVTLYKYSFSEEGCAGMGPLAANLMFNATLLVQFVGVARTNRGGAGGGGKGSRGTDRRS